MLLSHGGKHLTAASNYLRYDPTKIVWSDEFDGTTLSYATDEGGGTWRTRGYEAGASVNEGYKDYAGSSWNISPVQHPDHSPFDVNDSILTITVSRNPGLPDVDGAEWLGGYLVSNHLNNLTWRYGYFEWRMSLPDPIRGMFPALWMFNNIPGRSDGKEGAEIDVMEIFGYKSGQPWQSGIRMQPTPDEDYKVGSYNDDTAGWHRYGVEWLKDKIIWYKDGTPIGEVTGPRAEWFANADLGLRIDYVMDPNWLPDGDPNKSTASDPAPAMSSRMLIDYVRVYNRKPSDLPTGTDDPTTGQ